MVDRIITEIKIANGGAYLILQILIRNVVPLIIE